MSSDGYNKPSSGRDAGKGVAPATSTASSYLVREDVSKVSPSSLLGDEPPPRRSPPNEEIVGARVSPETLLSASTDEKPVAKKRSRWVWGAFASAALFLGVLGLVVFQPQKSVQELMSEAATFQERGDHVSASILLKEIVGREPENVEAQLKLGRAYVATGALVDAEAAIKRAQELGAPREETIPAIAQLLIDLERHDDALKMLGGGSLDFGKASGASIALLMGKAYLGVGNTVEARTQFTIARNDLPGPAMIGIARVMALEGDADGSRQLIDEATAKYPNTVEAWIAKGDSLRGRGKDDEAIAAYRAAEALAPGSVEAIVSGAITHIGQGQMEEAQRQLRKARAVSPNSHHLRFANAVLAFNEKRYDECREWLNSILGVLPKHLPSIYLAGVLSLSLGHLEQAEVAFNDYLSMLPGSVDARKMLATVLLRKQRPQAAVDVVAPLADLDVKDPQFLLVAGEAYLQVGDTARARELLAKAARLDASNYAVLTTLGRVQMAEGATDTAIADFEKAIALKPKDPYPYRRLAVMLMARGRVDDALGIVDSLQRTMPESPEHHWLRGLAHELKKDESRARTSFEAALKADPSFLPAAAALAQQAHSRGDAAAARSLIEGVLKASPGSVDAVLTLARMDFREGKLEKALTAVARLADDKPDVTAVQVMLAELQWRAGQKDAALNTARRVRETNPRDPRAAELLGGMQFESKDLGGAVQSFTAMVNARPKYVRGRLMLAEAQVATGQHRAAIVTLQEALTLGATRPEVFLMLGSLLLQEKQFTEALSVAEKAKRQLPKRSTGLQLEGETRLSQGDAKLALAAFQAASRVEATERLQVYLHHAESQVLGREAPMDSLLKWIATRPNANVARLYAADALVRSGRVPEAIPIYQGLLNKDPGNHVIINNLADAMVRQGDPRALEFAQKAYQARPNDAVTAATLGAAFLSLGKIGEALLAFQNAVKLDPKDPEIRYQLALALVKAGDRARAKVELAEVISSGRTFPHLADARELARKL